MRTRSKAVKELLGSTETEPMAGGVFQASTSSAALSRAARIGLLAPGGPDALPPLEEVQSQLSNYEGTASLFQFCQTLVHAGIATERSWKQTKGDPLAFIDESLRRWCYLHGSDRIESGFGEFVLSIEDGGRGKLTVAVMHRAFSVFLCRAPLEALEKHAKGLGLAFYKLLLFILGRTLGSWDLGDAEYCLECMKDSIEQRKLEGETGEEYELPDIEGCIPAFIAEARDTDVPLRRHWSLLRAHSSGPFGPWVRSLLRMYTMKRLPIDDHLIADDENGGYDMMRAVPAAVLAFESNDAIIQAFDEEMEMWNQCSSPPLLTVKCDPFNPTEMQGVWAILRVYFAIALETATLEEEWRLWAAAEDKKHGDQCRARAQLAGCAA